MKSKLFPFSLMLVLALIISGCNNKHDLGAKDTDFYTSIIAEEHIINNDYSSFKEMYMKDSQENISQEKFNQISKIIDDVATFKEYELISYDNGEMLLFHFVKVEGEPKIVDVTIVPDDIKAFFEK